MGGPGGMYRVTPGASLVGFPGGFLGGFLWGTLGVPG